MGSPRDIIRDTLPDNETGRTGQYTVTTTAATPTDNDGDPLLFSGVLLKAPSGNTNPIYVGFNSGLTTSNGYSLAPGEELAVAVSRLSKLFFRVASGNETLEYMAL